MWHPDSLHGIFTGAEKLSGRDLLCRDSSVPNELSCSSVRRGFMSYQYACLWIPVPQRIMVGSAGTQIWTRILSRQPWICLCQWLPTWKSQVNAPTLLLRFAAGTSGFTFCPSEFIVCHRHVVPTAGVGDKQLLRQFLWDRGLLRAASPVKRAIQFGTRLGNLASIRDLGTNRSNEAGHAGTAAL